MIKINNTEITDVRFPIEEITINKVVTSAGDVLWERPTITPDIIQVQIYDSGDFQGSVDYSVQYNMQEGYYGDMCEAKVTITGTAGPSDHYNNIVHINWPDGEDESFGENWLTIQQFSTDRTFYGALGVDIIPIEITRIGEPR